MMSCRPPTSVCKGSSPTRLREKAGKEHRAPLSDAALAIIDAMAEVRQGDFVFPRSKDPPPSEPSDAPEARAPHGPRSIDGPWFSWLVPRLRCRTHGFPGRGS